MLIHSILIHSWLTISFCSTMFKTPRSFVHSSQYSPLFVSSLTLRLIHSHSLAVSLKKWFTHLYILCLISQSFYSWFVHSQPSNYSHQFSLNRLRSRHRPSFITLLSSVRLHITTLSNRVYFLTLIHLSTIPCTHRYPLNR